MLRKEITLLLLIKLILLFILWKTCFAHPIEEHLTNQDVATHILTPHAT